EERTPGRAGQVDGRPSRGGGSRRDRGALDRTGAGLGDRARLPARPPEQGPQGYGAPGVDRYRSDRPDRAVRGPRPLACAPHALPRRPRGAGGSGGRQQAGRGRERNESVAGLGQALAAAFLAVDDGQDAEDAAAGLLDRADRAQRTLARGHDVLDHDHVHPRPERTFDQAPGPVSLRLFPDRERVDRAPRERGRVCDRVGYGVGAEGEAADGVGPPTLLIEGLERGPAEERLALTAHRREARVDVVGGTPAARQHEVAEPDRATDEQLDEKISITHGRIASSQDSWIPAPNPSSSAASAPATAGSARMRPRSRDSMNSMYSSGRSADRKSQA